VRFGRVIFAPYVIWVDVDIELFPSSQCSCQMVPNTVSGHNNAFSHINLRKLHKLQHTKSTFHEDSRDSIGDKQKSHHFHTCSKSRGQALRR
jgi:hypothetical protein